MKEWVYILVNSSMPGLCKIGQTTRSPEARAEEISNSTGVPNKFEVYWKQEVSDCVRAEKCIHDALDEYREGKEFFRIDTAQASKMAEDICAEFPVTECSSGSSVAVQGGGHLRKSSSSEEIEPTKFRYGKNPVMKVSSTSSRDQYYQVDVDEHTKPRNRRSDLVAVGCTNTIATRIYRDGLPAFKKAAKASMSFEMLGDEPKGTRSSIKNTTDPDDPDVFYEVTTIKYKDGSRFVQNQGWRKVPPKQGAGCMVCWLLAVSGLGVLLYLLKDALQKVI